MAQYKRGFPIAVHPGEILRQMIEERGITQARLAGHLAVDAARINEVCRRRMGVWAQLTVLLGKALGTSAELWMNLQKSWELSQVGPVSARED